MRKALSLSAVFAAVVLAACGGDDRPTDQTATPGAAPADQPAGTPAPAPADAGTAAHTAGLPPGVTAQMVSEGGQLYQGVCVACHGVNGAGGPLGPALNDQNWIHITGEFEEIVNIIRSGVAQPQQYPAPMPAMGGGNYNDDQLRALAAYVWSMSHGT